MDIEKLVASYRGYLQASVQLREIGAFGGGLADMFRGTIRAHQEAEEAYVREQLIARSKEVDDLKAISHK
jgi:hypothetical protein